jgi:hypothetical protein
MDVVEDTERLAPPSTESSPGRLLSAGRIVSSSAIEVIRRHDVDRQLTPIVSKIPVSTGLVRLVKLFPLAVAAGWMQSVKTACVALKIRAAALEASARRMKTAPRLVSRIVLDGELKEESVTH